VITKASRSLGWWSPIALLLTHFAVTGCTASSSIAKAVQTSQQQQEIIAACTDLVMDYAVFRDRVDVEGYTGLFGVDGSLTLRGETFKGQEAIRARISEAINGPRTRHLMSTIHITPLDENRAIGVSYVTIYSAPQSNSESEPAMVQGFTAIGDYVDEFVRAGAGWRISKRTLEIQFLFGEN